MCQISLHARLFGTLEYFSPEVCLSHKKHTMARFEKVFLSNMKTDCKLTLFLIFYDTQIQVPLMVLGKTLHKLSPHFEFTLTLDLFFHIFEIKTLEFHYKYSMLVSFFIYKITNSTCFKACKLLNLLKIYFDTKF